MTEIEEPKYIQFIPRGLSKSGKTKVWHVTTKEDSTELLGEIIWFGRWRCYAFWAYNAYFEKRCLRDIANFCEQQTKLQKEKS